MPAAHTSILQAVLDDPGHIFTIRWAELCAAFPPARLSSISRWAVCFQPSDVHAMIRSDVYRHMAGRITRTAVVAKQDLSVTKSFGRATVRFAVFEKSISRFALDLYQAEGFAHEPHLVRYLHDTVDETTLLVDVGAHFGYFSCLVAALGGTVIAVELQRTLCLNIEANVVLNDFWRIHVICAAIGPTPGITQVERLDPTPGKQVTSRQFNASKFPMTSQNHEIVPVVTVDTLVGDRLGDEFSRVIVKLDIEGAEILALRGAGQTIAARAAIFVVEIHLSELAKFGGALEEVLDLFPETAWRWVRMDDDGESEVSHADLIAYRAAWNVDIGNLCVRFEPL